MVIHDFDLMRIAALPEDDPLWPVHHHGANRDDRFQLKQADAAQARKVVQRARNVEFRQPLSRQLDVQAGELRLAGFDELARRRSFDGSYHT